jgi:hypothetical protein
MSIAQSTTLFAGRLRNRPAGFFDQAGIRLVGAHPRPGR